MLICGDQPPSLRHLLVADRRLGDRLLEHLPGRARSRPRLIWPDCSSPSRLPAPRMSRSWLASVKPAPSESSDCSTFSRFSAWRGQRLARRHGQKRIGALLGAADPPAELVELRQAEHVGAVDDQRVGGRNVEARLDDGGREQHVELAVVEGAHHVFELGRRHLAMRDHELHLRHLLAQERRACSSRSAMRGTT